ncbi:MAG: HEAT repeat domain-containing protein [Nevskiales bacterium]|nr:HEAT repeat domain-containing protein [Nevskiales bacterium]
MVTFAADAVIVLLISILVFSSLALMSRFLEHLRRIRLQRLERKMRTALQAYLAGSLPAAETVVRLHRPRPVALRALLDVASGLPAEPRERLHPVLERLHLHEHQLTALRHRDWTRRAHAASWLGVLHYRNAIPALIAALQDEMLDVRIAAAYALVRLEAGEAVKPVLFGLALPGAWPLQRAAEIFQEMGPKAIPPLLQALNTGNVSNAVAAVVLRTLGLLEAIESVPVLIRYLSHSDTELRISSAKSLGQIGRPETAEALGAALEDPAWEVRNAAAQALGRLKDASVIPALLRKLSDPAWWVRFNAAEALFRLNGIRALREASLTHSDRFARDISRQILEERGFLTAEENLA